MELIISNEVEILMNERGITKEDIETVIKNAEVNKTFIIADDQSVIAKYRMNNFCPYVEYTREGDTYTIKTVYAHTVLLGYEMN